MTYHLLQASLAWNHFLLTAAGDEKRKKHHVSLQPAVIADIFLSSLWWLREDSPFSRVRHVTQQQLRSFAERAAAGLPASVCGCAALLLEEEFLTSHQSEGALAQQLAADKRTCGLTQRCITVANGMVKLWPFTSAMMTCLLFFPLLFYSQTWLQRGSWRWRKERSWRR